MRKISNSSRPNARGDSASQDAGAGDADGRYSHIKAANRKIRLIDVLRHYGFKIEKNHQRPSWSDNIICPLPTHKGAKERTPSFGYCFVSDHGHCLGCNWTGRGVEFISAYEGISRTAVAERVLAQYGEDVSADDLSDYEDDLSPVLLDGSKFLQELTQKHKDNPKALQHIGKLVWWLDFYLMAKAPGHKIDAKELKYRIERVKELLSDEVLNSR
jgi:hypothetical protein